MATRAPTCRNGAVPLCVGRGKRDHWLPATPIPSGHRHPDSLFLSMRQGTLSPFFSGRKLGVQKPKAIAPSLL